MADTRSLSRQDMRQSIELLDQPQAMVLLRIVAIDSTEIMHKG